MNTKLLFSLPRFRCEKGQFIEDREGPIVRYADVVAAEIARSAEMQMTDAEIYNWWSSENGLEDCAMYKLDDFRAVVRAVEKRLSR